MNFFVLYPLVLSVLMVFMVGWLLPRAGSTYDLFRLKLQLYPNWFKYLSIIWIVITIILSFFLSSSSGNNTEFVAVNVNFSLFVFFFSKEKDEDEFSEQLRLKAFIYSFISFVSFLILFGGFKGSQLSIPDIFLDFIFVQIFLGIALLTSLVYFYITKYKVNKNIEG